MATKTAKTPKVKPNEVGVMFRAPQEIRGAIRSVSAWAEMNNVRINGRTPLEKDIWAWLAATLYASGQENWESILAKGAKSYSDLISQN